MSSIQSSIQPSKDISVDNQTTPSPDSAYSRVSSVDSNLTNDSVSFSPSSPIELPDSSRLNEEEQDDDTWMDSFGKETLMTTSSISASETPSAKKKDSTSSGLETRTYSFSIGNILTDPMTYEDGDDGDKQKPNQQSSNINNENEPWVKRDSKERVPVRKQLKPVNVRSVVSISDEAPSDLVKAESSVITNDNNNSCDTPLKTNVQQEISIKVNIDQTKTNDSVVNESITDTPLRSPSKQGPTVLPKPKKPLDKKSWTADLIKSKTQEIPEHPQPGSLNEKLLHGVKNPEGDENIARTSSIGKKPSVKEIRDKFQSTEDSSIEKYV